MKRNKPFEQVFREAPLFLQLVLADHGEVIGSWTVGDTRHNDDCDIIYPVEKLGVSELADLINRAVRRHIE